MRLVIFCLVPLIGPQSTLADDVDMRLNSLEGLAVLEAADAGTCAPPAQALRLRLQSDASRGVLAPANFYGAPIPVSVITRRANQEVTQNVHEPVAETRKVSRANELVQRFSITGDLAVCAYGPQFEVTGGDIRIEGEAGNYRFETASSLQSIIADNQTNIWMRYEVQPFRAGVHPERNYNFQADQLTIPAEVSLLPPLGVLGFHIDEMMVTAQPIQAGLDPVDVVARLSVDFVVVNGLED